MMRVYPQRPVECAHAEDGRKTIANRAEADRIGFTQGIDGPGRILAIGGRP